MEEQTLVSLPFSTMDISDDLIIHKGLVSPDMNQYFITVSDLNYQRFDILVSKLSDGAWSTSIPAFFNSEYSDHGMNFSPDGRTIWWSSTRPTGIDTIPSTWHIWKVEMQDNNWSEPIYVDIPNLRDKLISHPSVSSIGTLFFHSSELDFSDMAVFRSEFRNGKYEDAVPVFSDSTFQPSCTPYIAPDERYLILAKVNQDLDLMISFKDEAGGWSIPEVLSESINLRGQGNPSITSDGKMLLYTTVTAAGVWQVNQIHFEDIRELLD